MAPHWVIGHEFESTTSSLAHDIFTTTTLGIGVHHYWHSMRAVMVDFRWTEEQIAEFFPSKNFTEDHTKVDCRACLEIIHS
jgi:hypothetical protein